MTHDLWTLTTRTAACGCVCVRLCLDDTELIHSGEGKKTTTPEYLNVLTESGL